MAESAIADYLSIAFEKENEDIHLVPGTNVELYLDTKSYVSYEKEDQAQDMKRNQQHRRIYGEVVSTPRKLSGLPLSRVNPGVPNPKRHVSHEVIQEMVRIQPNEWGRKDYSAADFDVKFERLSDFEMIAQPGDRAYVHYDCLNPEFFAGKYKDHYIYYVRYDNIICMVRRGDILMCAGHTLVKPLVDSMEESKTVSGIYTQSVDKPRYLQGTLVHVASNNKYGLKVGSHVYYETNSDWENEIEGQKYYVIKEKDIMLTIGDGITPNGDRVFLEVPEEITKTKRGILLGRALKANNSIVVAAGDEARKHKPGTRVHFTPNAGTEVEVYNKKYLVIRDTDILAYDTAKD